MYKFFEFSDGRNVLVEANSIEQAITVIKDKWWSDIFEECDFKVTTVQGMSLSDTN